VEHRPGQWLELVGVQRKQRRHRRHREELLAGHPLGEGELHDRKDGTAALVLEVERRRRRQQMMTMAVAITSSQPAATITASEFVGCPAQSARLFIFC